MIKSATLAVRVPTSLFASLVRRFNSFTCLVMNGGHELYVVRGDVDSHKVYQQCLLCGHKTNGWKVGK